jgi:hypothetical protein
MDFEEQLSTAMRSSVETLSPPVTDLVAAGLERGRRLRRHRRLTRGAMAVAAVVALAGAGAAVVRDDSSSTSTSVANGAAACRSVVLTGVLPVWARDGFSDAEPTAQHVMSAHGDMTAILFGATLNSPPAADRNNKILWVTRVPQSAPGPLRIDAVREGTATHVRRQVAGGPGPSIVDLPQPGCWHLTLRWGAHRDTMDLAYVRP